MRTWILVGVFLGVLIIAFTIFIIRLEEGPTLATVEAESGAPITDIHFTDSYRGGLHTLKGRAIVPTACTTISAVASIEEATTTVLRLDLAAPIDTEICLELPTQTTFSTTVEGPGDLPIDVYANGVLATSTP